MHYMVLPYGLGRHHPNLKSGGSGETSTHFRQQSGESMTWVCARSAVWHSWLAYRKLRRGQLPRSTPCGMGQRLPLAHHMAGFQYPWRQRRDNRHLPTPAYRAIAIESSVIVEVECIRILALLHARALDNKATRSGLVLRSYSARIQQALYTGRYGLYVTVGLYRFRIDA